MVPVVVADLKGRVCIVTPAAMSMFNWEREEDLVGHPVTEYVAPEDRDRAAANIARMVSGELVGPVQYRALLKSGAVIAIEVGGELIRGVDGSPTGLMLLVREMTERLRAEADIIQERSLLEALLENIPEPRLLQGRRLPLRNDQQGPRRNVRADRSLAGRWQDGL